MTSVLGMVGGVATRVRLTWLRFAARRRCRLGDGSVVYEPGRILAYGGSGSIAIGRGTHVRGELLTFPGGVITIGDDCYVGEQSRVWAAGAIEIGSRVLIAHLVTIVDNTTHPLDHVARHEHYRTILTRGHVPGVDLSPRPVRIGDDAWIACSAVILSGVTIGRGAVVGAGSVVVDDVAPFTLVAGNPARVIKKLGTDGSAPGGT